MIVDVTAFGYAYGQMAQQPLYFESDKTFVAKIQESLSQLDLITSILSFPATKLSPVAIKPRCQFWSN